MKYVEVASFDSRLEAETVGHALDQYDIPFMVQSPDVGMFGPGMVGWSPVGVTLMVPEERLEEVRSLLTCVVRLDPEEPTDGSDPDASGETPPDPS